MRFNTPGTLQRHKREGHRATAQNADVLEPSGPNGAGFHMCNQINSSAGRPCRSMFSRPYYLSRHELAIHNTRRRKVRCSICAEEKTFSRLDALRRHLQVVHPNNNVKSVLKAAEKRLNCRVVTFSRSHSDCPRVQITSFLRTVTMGTLDAKVFGQLSTIDISSNMGVSLFSWPSHAWKYDT